MCNLQSRLPLCLVLTLDDCGIFSAASTLCRHVPPNLLYTLYGGHCARRYFRVRRWHHCMESRADAWYYQAPSYIAWTVVTAESALQLDIVHLKRQRYQS